MPVSHSTEKLTTKEKALLLDLAQKTIAAHAPPATPSLTKPLMKPRGVFVTLTSNGQLRGCIGYVLPIQPLYQAVIENALNAAYGDPRFSPVTEKEFAGLTIEISALTEPEPLKHASPAQLIQLLETDMGIIVKKGIRSATFLPQVWEQIPNRKDFMSQLCLKAGLPSDAWQHDTEIFSYRVEAFEKKWNG
jgi:uncharacterized protein